MGVKKEINWDMLELYLKAGCKQMNICKAFGIDDDTLRYKVKNKYGIDYAELSGQLRSEGEMLIEAQQFQKAMKGYWPALHWLGKCRIGQREPEMLNQLAANQPNIDQSHRIMELEHENLELKSNANKPKTE